MNIKNLQDSPQYFNQVISLIEESFGYEKRNSFLKDFYPLMNNHNHKHCWILLDRDTLVGHIGVRLVQLNNDVEVSMMGGIAMNPEYRGQGIFKDFFREILAKYDDTDFSLLWSDQHELYNKFDFELIGTQYTLLKVDGMQSTFTKVKEIDDNTKEQIKSLYNNLLRNEVSIRRTDQDWNNIWNIESADLYIAKKKNDILSYFFMNKGQDLTNIIHEAYFANDHHLEAAATLGTLWLPHQYSDYAEFDEKLGLVKFNNKIDVSKLWISGLDSI